MFVTYSELNFIVTSLKRELALRETRYQQTNDTKEVEVEEEKPIVERTPSLSEDIEILGEEEKQRVLEDEYTNVTGKIALKLRSTTDETQVVVIRMGIVRI